jgi:dedicated sortase system histidine kinase
VPDTAGILALPKAEMTLRRKLLLLALVTLLLPVSAWLLIRELEAFLREGQQQALQATAATIARSLTSDMQALGQDHPQQIFAVPLDGSLALDGYADGWSEINDGSVSWQSADRSVSIQLRAGVHGQSLYLLAEVLDTTPVRQNLGRDGDSDSIELGLHGSRGMVRFGITSAGTGPLNIVSSGASGEQIAGYWLDRTDGYTVELRVPWFLAEQGMSFRLMDVEDDFDRDIVREIVVAEPVVPIQRSAPVQQSLELLLGSGQRVWIVDKNGFVRAQLSRTLATGRTIEQAAWAERLLHRLLTIDRSPPTGDPPAISARLSEPLVETALAGTSSGNWRQLPVTAELLNSVATPIVVGNAVVGAVFLQASSDGLLLLTNRALGRILGISLLTTMLLALALYLFASRLSGRVRRLSKAVRSASTDPSRKQPDLPLTLDKDELGELARSHGRLLKAVRDYNAYLKTLAGKLSHELKTPLVIMQSSLENMEREQLDPAAKTYLSRAREGGERLSEILRAMSEASRLENAIGDIDPEAFQLDEVIRQTTAAYKQVYTSRTIELQIEEAQYPAHGGPEMIAQLLDKLVNNAISLTGDDDHIMIMLERKGDTAIIRVRNSGTHLPERMQGQLFESLVSVREKKGEEPHLGLGLYLVKLITEAHGGTVRAINLPANAGVEFSVTLPLSPAMSHE